MTSRSQFALRGTIVAASVLAVALALANTPDPVWVVGVLLVALAAYVAQHPGSHLFGVLVGALALHWLALVPTPTSTTDWASVVAEAVLVLVVHASGALAASLPPQAPVPASSIRRWVRRVAVVVAACVPVWAVAAAVSTSAQPGQAVFTYAAIAGTAVLALGVYLGAREPGT